MKDLGKKVEESQFAFLKEFMEEIKEQIWNVMNEMKRKEHEEIVMREINHWKNTEITERLEKIVRM